MFIDLKKILPRNVRGKIMYMLRWLPDKPYIQLFYFATTGRFVNFRNPKNFSEKLQWIKVYDKHPEYSVLADKLKVRDIVKEKLGHDCSFPLLGSWEKFEDIDFDKLPNDFVLKCNHDSGSVKIIHGWKSLPQSERDEIAAFYKNRLKENFFYAGREFAYKNIEPRIFAEQFIDTGDDGGIKDYKFFCFNGEPKLLLLVSGRQTDHCEDFFDMDFKWFPEIRTIYHSSKECPAKPECFEEMKEYARILSAGIREVRMDFYEVNGKVYFGEYTFFEGGGFELFQPPEWERRLGDWIKID